MAKIVSVHSFRGGTGKSNLTANLATTVALAGNRRRHRRHRHPVARHPRHLRPG